MCGIAGYVSKREWSGSAMVDSLIHRGPDGRGAYTEKWGEHNVFMGHTRLAIVDLSKNGQQPMMSHRREGVIAFNGEIYNFETLRQSLKSSVPFRSTTDTEVLLELLAKRGMEALPELNGDFAFAYLDRNNQKFYLVRDRLGIKPLYFSWHSGTLHFGSEIKAVLAGGVSAELETDNLQRYFAFKYSPGQETLFRGIERIPPAHYLCMDLQSGQLTTHKYWSPQKVEVGKTYSDRCEELRELLTDSVKMRLVADVPVSTFLSGGLDSSIIASILRNEKDIRHYCATKDEKDIRAEGTSSDAAFADSLAADWALNYTRIPIGNQSLTPEMIRTTLRFSDDLIADGSQIPSYLITQNASAKSTVVLTGMGADELFFGYAGHIITRWADQLDGAPSLLSGAMAKTMAMAHPGKGRLKAVKRYLYKLGRYYRHPHRFAPLSVVGDWNTSLSVFPGDESALESLLEKYHSPSGLQSLEGFERDNFLVKNLHYTDRMSMANGMESRVPFLDHRLVEWAYSLPFSDRLSGVAHTKRILKDSFKADLPTGILKRRKAGFGMPLRSLLANPETVSQLMDPAFFANFDGFNADSIQRIITDHRAGVADHSSVIYSLISFEHWYKMYISN